MTLRLPERVGPRPQTTTTLPHQQCSDNPSAAIHEATHARFVELVEVDIGPSQISVPGATALRLPEGQPCNPEACFAGSEFAHIHPQHDGSFHMSLAPEDCEQVLKQGWGELHPLAGTGRLSPTVAMIYAPRTEAEIEIVLEIARASYRWATYWGAP